MLAIAADAVRQVIAVTYGDIRVGLVYTLRRRCGLLHWPLYGSSATGYVSSDPLPGKAKPALSTAEVCAFGISKQQRAYGVMSPYSIWAS
jgi:hypothetical protein